MENVYESAHELRAHCANKRLDSCTVKNADLTGEAFGEFVVDRVSFKSVGFSDGSFEHAFLHHCSFNESRLRSTRMVGAHLRGVSLFNSELIEANFRGALLEGAKIYDCKLMNARFDEARILNATVSGSDLHSVSFENALLMHSSFVDRRMENAQLSSVSFKNALLVDVDLHGANLYGADFTGAILVKVDFRDANLISCSFEGATLIDTPLDRADLDEHQRSTLKQQEASQPMHALNQQARISAALQGVPNAELSEMMAHLMKAYVLDGTTPLRPEAGKVIVPTHLRDLDFAGLVDALKLHLDLPELDKLTVTDGLVSVNLGGSEYAIDGRSSAVPTGTSTASPPAPAPAPAPASARAAPSPGPGSPFGGGTSPAAVPPPSAAPPEPAAVPPAPEKPEEPGTVSNRFRMLELD